MEDKSAKSIEEAALYFESPISSDYDVAEVVVCALYKLYDLGRLRFDRLDLSASAQKKTNFYPQDVDEVINRLFDKKYLQEDGDRVVFGVKGLWLLEDACMNDYLDIDPELIAHASLDRDHFFDTKHQTD